MRGEEVTIPSMDFGGALRALRSGKMVRRAGWNGKGMYLLLVRPHLGHSDLGGPDGLLPVAPSIAMRTAQDTICVGWLASQADMLSDDWEVML